MLKNRMLISIFCSVMVLITNSLVNFILTPFIVANIGVEANGFITLANDCITYTNLIVIALNSMAARFITIEYVKKEYNKANLYYNSVFWGNIFLAFVLLIPVICFLLKLEYIIDVPEQMVNETKIMFVLVFLNFFVGLILPNWDCGTFVVNHLEKTYILQICTVLLRAVILFVIFNLFTPKIWFVGIAAVMVNIVTLSANFYFTKKYTPRLRISLLPSKILFSKKAIKELIGSGIWNSISNIGTICLNGLDLLVCNLLLGPIAMGIIAIAKMLAGSIDEFSMSLSRTFIPKTIINYAKDDKQAILNDLGSAMKITTIALTIAFAGVVVFGRDFFALWMPAQDSRLLHYLAILAILKYLFTSGTQILYVVFPATNHVKEDALSILISGIVSFVVTIILIRMTNWGIYAVAGVSSISLIARNMFFVIPMSAKYMGFSWRQFFPYVGESILSSFCLIGLFAILKIIIAQNTWITFAFSVLTAIIIGFFFNFCIVFRKSERKCFYQKICNKLREKENG